MSDIYATNAIPDDGFGAQYQKVIETYLFCAMHNIKFYYTPLVEFEHNYDNEPKYTSRLEECMNLKSVLPNIQDYSNSKKIINLTYVQHVRQYTAHNIDYYCDNKYMEGLKKAFWANKDTNFFKNNKTNIAVHIRRDNPHDKGLAGARTTTSNNTYLATIHYIRKNFNHKQLQFHIYSQGNKEDFKIYESNDTILHINEDIVPTFTGMVASDMLITSRSSLSYLAGLLSDGTVFYQPFWHPPRKNWYGILETIQGPVVVDNVTLSKVLHT